MAYKNIEDGYIWGICPTVGDIEITESEYNELMSIIHNRPTPSTGFDYKLKADTLTWELVELPPVEEQDDEATESDYINALQDLGVSLDE